MKYCLHFYCMHTVLGKFPLCEFFVANTSEDLEKPEVNTQEAQYKEYQINLGQEDQMGLTYEF